MKTILRTLLTAVTLTTLASTVWAAPAKRVTNTEHDNGTGSSKEIDPEKKQSTESFFNGAGKEIYKIVYQLDDRLQPVSGIYYNNAGKIFQKSRYTLDGADRMIQEVVYDSRDSLVCTKNYIWGTRFGQSALIEVQVYDRNGNLTKNQRGNTLRRSR